MHITTGVVLVVVLLSLTGWFVTASNPDQPIKLSVSSQISLSALYTAHQTAHHTHQAVLDPEGVFTVFWTPDLPKQEVVWELHVRTRGWLGFGFSANGGMAGSDILTAWVNEGQLYLQDRHGTGEVTPPLDNHADWRPLHAHENDTHTVLVVARDINTCDPHDYVLTNETVKLIYAWGLTDPSDQHPSYHGPRRGNKYALVLLPFHQPPLPSDAQKWSVRQSVTMPHEQDTFYWCHVEKIPKWEKKHHYIGFEMIYGRNAHRNLHHSVAFECHTNDGTDPALVMEQYVGHPGYECYTPNMPEHFYLCEIFLINWAIGSEGELLPERVGVPLGDQHGGATYLLFQTHYDNTQMDHNVIVDWGMDIYYTENIRPVEAGNLGLGHSLLFSLTVPPHSPSWLVAGHCASECTALTIPREGVQVFNVFLHAHYLARAIRLRHFRGTVELPPIMEDLNYAADFQQSRRLSTEVKILPGDHLTVECDYDSRNKNITTFLGWKSNDEMCNAFLNYYPRFDMALCRSSPELQLLKDNFRLKSFPEDLNVNDFIFDPDVGDDRGYQEAVNALPWDSLDHQAINERLLRGDQIIKCQFNYGAPIQLSTNLTRYPRATPYVPPKDTTCAHVHRSHYQLLPSSSLLWDPNPGLVICFLLIMLQI